jgi:hypothetical protein
VLCGWQPPLNEVAKVQILTLTKVQILTQKALRCADVLCDVLCGWQPPLNALNVERVPLSKPMFSFRFIESSLLPPPQKNILAAPAQRS